MVADAGNERIRVVATRSGIFYGRHMTAGDIYTIAGNGNTGYAGDGGPARKATLSDPEAVAIDGAGNVVIADTANSVIRMVTVRSGTFYGKKMTASRIYAIAGTGRVYGYAGDGGPAARALLSFPGWLAIGRAGNILIGDWGNGTVRSLSR